MSTAPNHPQLESWLIANACKPVYWTAMTSVSGIEGVAAAMSDLQRMVVQDSDEDIAAFFAAVRRRMSEHAPPSENNGENRSSWWPPETD